VAADALDAGAVVAKDATGGRLGGGGAFWWP
jgi:hypothetical protein